MINPNYLIKKLKLMPHPEGGHYAESFRDKEGNVSLIYYLLQEGETSHWHKLTKNEILHFYDGDPVEIFLSKDKKEISTIILGRNINNQEYLHYVIKSQTWFGMKSTGSWSLIGCTVAPAFDYKDFELASKDWKI
tara:strand:- start:51 stop:455 length:405 start_codon:yes stop_codon:yes gene_type:complete